MIRLILLFSLSFIINTRNSQNEQVILNQAFQNYRKELPKLEKQAFKELRKLDKSKLKIKSSEFNKYHFIIIPMFKLKVEFDKYHIGDNFVNYIDFGKLHNDFETFVFKDTIFKGSLHFSDFDKSYFSINDTNNYNKTSFNGQYSLVRQIISFKPDMVFYPDCTMFLCFIKEGRLYIGKSEKQLQKLESILPVDEFIKNNPSFIKELQDNKNLELKYYLELH